MLQKEQKPFYESNDGGNLPLTWAQTRNMPLTNRVCMHNYKHRFHILFHTKYLRKLYILIGCV